MFSDIGTGRLETNFKDDKRAHNFAAATRIAIFISVGLLSTAGGLTGNPDKAKTQALLSKIAYFEFAIVIVALTGACLYLYFKQRHTIKPSQVIYLKWLLVASPALYVRVAYGLISVFRASGNHILTSMWSPLFGSAAAFSLMALLPEYVVLCIYLYLGYHRYSTCTIESVADERPPKKQEKAKKESNQRKGGTSDSIELV
ncbi:hypothetical protein jhhlp_006635 [Lomentospora prolificans]|uniref:DUF7702 domain-containing protein n=1 Tax=Lomentospora prolificans TaxID=41688 RepID=A0A2N3N6E5_9PEZI|nr:hypothetical protein jhhlp_006635 [Lomentospora prolificans]